MSVDFSTLSVDKALVMALKSEADAEAVYSKLHLSVKNFILREGQMFHF